MYEGDTPNAERRAAALALDRDLLAELLGQEELRELIDPEALEEVAAQLQHLTEAGLTKDRDGLQQILRRLGDLTAEECEQRTEEGYSAASMLEKLVKERTSRPGPDRRRGALHRRRGRRPLSRRARGAAAGRAAGELPRAGRGRARLPGAALRRHPRAVPDQAARRPLRGRPELGPEGAGAIRRRGPRRAPARRNVERVVRGRRTAPPAARQPRPPAPGGGGDRPARAGPLPAELAERRRPRPLRRGTRSPARGAHLAAGGGAHAEDLGARRPAPPARLLQPHLARRALHQR